MPLRKEEIIRPLDVGLIVNKKLNAKIHTAALDNNCWICSVRWLSLWARNLSFLDFPGSTTSGLVGKAPGRAPGSWNGGIMEADIPTCGLLGESTHFFFFFWDFRGFFYVWIWTWPDLLRLCAMNFWTFCPIPGWGNPSLCVSRQLCWTVRVWGNKGDSLFYPFFFKGTVAHSSLKLFVV